MEGGDTATGSFPRPSFVILLAVRPFYDIDYSYGKLSWCLIKQPGIYTSHRVNYHTGKGTGWNGK